MKKLITALFLLFSIPVFGQDAAPERENEETSSEETNSEEETTPKKFSPRKVVLEKFAARKIVAEKFLLPEKLELLEENNYGVILPPIPTLSPVEKVEPVLAGFYKGAFFIRDARNRFRISPKLRLHIHTLAAFPKSDTAVKSSVLIRRARPALSIGLLEEKIQVFVEAELSGKGSALVDGWIRAYLDPWFSLQFGQFTVPFGLENITSNSFIDFIERSAVHTNFVPTEKEPGIMIFGGASDQSFVYQFGFFNGAGKNATNENGYFETIGRIAFQPLKTSGTVFSETRFGGAFALSPRERTRDPRIGMAVGKDWLQTSTKHRFFEVGNLMNDGMQTRFAGELDVPVGRFELRSEAMMLRSKTRTEKDGFVMRKAGALDAYGAYLTLGYWLIGKRHIKRYGGVSRRHLIPKILPKSKGNVGDDFHFQLLLRGEFIHADYRPGVSKSKAPDPKNAGTYDWFVVTMGANWWWTKHIRLSFNYTINHLSRDREGTSSIVLHEIGTRAGIQF